MTLTLAPILIGLPALLGQDDVVLLLMLRDTGGVVSLATVLQHQPQSKMPSQAYANYAMVPLQVLVSLSDLNLPVTSLLCRSSFLCMCSVFRCHAWYHFHQWRLYLWGLYNCSPSKHTHGRHMSILVMVIGPHQECVEWLLLPLLWVGGVLCYLVSCPPAIPTICWGIQLWGLGRVTQSLKLPYMVGRGLLFQLWFHLMAQSALNLWWASTWWFCCSDWVSGWLVHSHLFYRVICFLFTFLP